MSVPSSSDCGLRCPICQFGITVNPTHEKANVPKIPTKRGASPFMSAWFRRTVPRCRDLRRENEGALSLVSSGLLCLDWVEECGDSRCASQSQKHQPKVIRENKMRRGKQNPGETAPAQIGQRRFDALAERERRILHVRALKETAGEQHERHQPDAVSRCPEMEFDQRSVTPFAANQAWDDVVHRTENHHGEK